MIADPICKFCITDAFSLLQFSKSMSTGKSGRHELHELFNDHFSSEFKMMNPRLVKASLPIELRQFSLEPLSLPYTIETVQDQSTLEQCIRLRSEAYHRHNEELGQLLSEPEPEDFDPHFTNLIARSKLSGELLAAVRVEIQTTNPLSFEKSYRLPKALKTGPIADIARLSIAKKVGFSPRLMMIKAAYWWCRSHGVVRHFITARQPADRLYRRFEMQDLIPHQGMVPIKSIANIPHRIMWIDVFDISKQWMETGNPLLSPIFLQSHPEILDDLQSRTIFQELLEIQVSSVVRGG